MTLDYQKWLEMSNEERQKLMRSWNPYEGDGADILRQAFERFEKSFGMVAGVVDMHSGIYHGGVLIIGVTIKKGTRVRLPKTFEGFPVVKMRK